MTPRAHPRGTPARRTAIGSGRKRDDLGTKPVRVRIALGAYEVLEIVGRAHDSALARAVVKPHLDRKLFIAIDGYPVVIATVRAVDWKMGTPDAMKFEAAAVGLPRRRRRG